MPITIIEDREIPGGTETERELTYRAGKQYIVEAIEAFGLLRMLHITIGVGKNGSKVKLKNETTLPNDPVIWIGEMHIAPDEYIYAHFKQMLSGESAILKIKFREIK